MSQHSEAGQSGGRRVAVVVAAGVGDSPRTDAAKRVANGLSVCAGFDPPVEHSEWFAAPGEIQPVQRFATASDGGTQVDVYEFWWADLSRFPAALRSFIAAFIGLFLAFPSIGRTALRNDAQITQKLQSRGPGGGMFQRLDYHLLGFLAWLLAVPVVVLFAMLLMTVGALVVAIRLPHPNSVTGAVVLGLYAVVMAVVGLGLLRHYEKQSERRPTFGLGVAAFLAGGGLVAWRLVERGVGGDSVELALADTLAALAAYPLRILWLAVLGTAFVTVVVLAARLLTAGADRRDRRTRTVSALLTLGVGPIGVALLTSIVLAAIGAVGEKVAKGVEWTGGGPLCLKEPDDWGLGRCGTLNAWTWGANVFAQTIYALAWAVGVTVAALVVVGLIAAVRRYVPRSQGGSANRQAERLTRVLGVIESPWTSGALLLATAAAAYLAASAWLPFRPFLHLSGHGTSWAPAVAAVLGGGVTALLLASRFMSLSPTALVGGGKAPGILRTVLDKPYDIATFVREPLGKRRFGHSADKPLPRQKMLGRYEALLEHLARKRYHRVVFVAHSQGTILTTTLLAEDRARLPREVSLLTFGCPLRQLYLQRFPSQYAWVDRLADPDTRTEFVKRVTGEWVNVATAGDPIGRTVFQPPPTTWNKGPAPALPEGSPALSELLLGRGGHTSYWKSCEVYEELARLID